MHSTISAINDSDPELTPRARVIFFTPLAARRHESALDPRSATVSGIVE